VIWGSIKMSLATFFSMILHDDANEADHFSQKESL